MITEDFRITWLAAVAKIAGLNFKKFRISWFCEKLSISEWF
jgi:hypothetical protein